MKANTISTEERFIGAIVGVACGDALGGPLEEIPNHPCSIQRPISDMIGGGWLKLKPGQITDDTEMTLCLLRSLVEKKAFDPYDIARKFHDWFYDNPIGTGGTTRAAMKRIHEGIPWSEAGLTDMGKESLGNGSLMRCAPIGLYRYREQQLLIHDSVTQGWITHPHKDCQDTVVFYNMMLAEILQGTKKTDAYLAALRYLSTNQELQKRYSRISSPSYTPIELTGAVAPTLETAVRCFLEESDAETTIIRAANMGGDADTRAAVVGALAGAYYGERQLPVRWKNMLVDRHGRPITNELVTLAKNLYRELE